MLPRAVAVVAAAVAAVVVTEVVPATAGMPNSVPPTTAAAAVTAAMLLRDGCLLRPIRLLRRMLVLLSRALRLLRGSVIAS